MYANRQSDRVVVKSVGWQINCCETRKAMNLSISYSLCAHSHNKHGAYCLFYLVFYLYAPSESNEITLT